MKNQFLPQEIALELKELGFDEPCCTYYDGAGYVMIKEMVYCVISAPTFAQVFRWFREKYDLDYEIPKAGRRGEYYAFVRSFVYGNNGNNPSIYTYEEAELVCVEKLIEIVKNK